MFGAGSSLFWGWSKTVVIAQVFKHISQKKLVLLSLLQQKIFIPYKNFAVD